MRRMFGIEKELKVEGLCLCEEWSKKKLEAVSASAVNRGMVKGFVLLSQRRGARMKIVTLTVVLVLLQSALGQLSAPLRFDQGLYSGTEGISIRVCLSIAQLAEIPQVECVVRVTVKAFISAGSNSATFGDDYTLNDGLDSANVTFTSRNAQSICFDVVLKNDGIVEGNEVFILRILAHSLVVSGSNCESVFIFDTMASATVTISDNSGNAPQFDEAVSMGVEGVNITGRLVIRGLEDVDLTGKLEYEITAGIVPGEISAIKDQDYVLITSIVTFRPRNEYSSEFVIQLSKDTLHEGDEVFQLGIKFHDATGTFRDLVFPVYSTFKITIKDDINDRVVCRLNPIDKDSSMSTLVDEGVTVNITSCCKGQFERPIMIGMSCQEIIAPDAATLPALKGIDYTFPAMFKFTYTPPDTPVDCVQSDNVFGVRILDDEAKGESIEQFTCDLRLGYGISSLATEDKEVCIEIRDSNECTKRNT